MILNSSVFSPLSMRLRARRSIAPRPAYASMHPLRPHGQRRPPILTTMWPISPAADRPIHGLPSSTMPPPTPVPQNTPSSER